MGPAGSAISPSYLASLSVGDERPVKQGINSPFNRHPSPNPQQQGDLISWLCPLANQVPLAVVGLVARCLPVAKCRNTCREEAETGRQSDPLESLVSFAMNILRPFLPL